MTKAMPLTKGKFTIVDDEDYEKLIVHKWYCSTRKTVHQAHVGENTEHENSCTCIGR